MKKAIPLLLTVAAVLRDELISLVILAIIVASVAAYLVSELGERDGR